MEFHLSEINDAISDAVPDRKAVVFGSNRLSYRELRDRGRKLANGLLNAGFGRVVERSNPWESRQDHLGIYLYNGTEYIEAMLGSLRARIAPFNINYRYVEDELVYLLSDAQTKILVFHADFSEQVDAIRKRVPSLEFLIQVNRVGDERILEGAIEYEDFLCNSSSFPPPVEPSPSDLVILYTGGTTGMPKGVLWRQSDLLIAALGRRRLNGTMLQTMDEFVDRALTASHRSLPAPPFMHGAGQWNIFQTLNSGGTIVIQTVVERFDPENILDAVERERVNNLLLVGDAFGRPIVDALKQSKRDLDSLQNIITGGAIMSAGTKQALIDALPKINIIDVAGSSEAGNQALHVSSHKAGVSTGEFMLTANSAVLSEDRTQTLEPDREHVGWWARSGEIPMGYLGDEQKTKEAFPIVNGVRYSVSGDKVRLLSDGSIELLGRESVTINSGGEKIFAEEVEQALKHHHEVFDAVVAGRPSDLWGTEVVAIVQLREGSRGDESSILAECSKRLARFKLPKAFVFVDEIQRSPSGKADYRWAKSIVSR